MHKVSENKNVTISAGANGKKMLYVDYTNLYDDTF